VTAAEVSSASVSTVVSVSTSYAFSDSDYVEVLAGQDTGGSLNVTSNLDYSPTFYMTRIA
jgi:hypothetical protein